MPFLVRKITRAKWDVSDEVGPINADAITQCLKTKDNTLSFWRVDTEENVVDGVLAIVASNDNLDKIDVVVLDEALLEGQSILIDSTPGRTACSELVDSHRDLAKLNVASLAVVSEAIAEQIRKGNTHRYTLTKLRALVLEAIEAGRINVEALSDGVKRKVLPQPPPMVVAPQSCPSCGAAIA
ncbi:hypothetical protein D3C77_396740 [compost metagenome]